MSTEERQAAIKECIDQTIRPVLQRDGGDIELLSIAEDDVVNVKLKGACAHCPMAMMTIKGFVEKQLRSVTENETLRVEPESF